MTEETPDPSPNPIAPPPDETLYRQAHPIHKKLDGSLSAGIFTPTKRDQGMLSTHREKIGAAESYRRWTEDLDHDSMGTLGVSLEEIDAVGVASDDGSGQYYGLQAIDDADMIGVPDHASVDFVGVPTPGKRKQAGRKLLEAAVARGFLYQP
ncbi:hypothetical protein [Nocardioides alkalitolerans]|uniref:hypothetical protein n=1 Tax=Nocardioides alkalitolerans TaxID=281714 RepID=UPI0012F8A12B|nr:hypothetical protein [Nocardioides alkalitolerans]